MVRFFSVSSGWQPDRPQWINKCLCYGYRCVFIPYGPVITWMALKGNQNEKKIPRRDDDEFDMSTHREREET